MTREPAGFDSNLRRVLLLLALFAWVHLPSASQSGAGSWPMVNLDAGATRYSALTQITPANVSHLKVAWIYHMKPAPAAGIAPDNAWRLSESQPLVVGNTMFVVTPYSRVVALDPATGREKWVFLIPGSDQASLRGAAYWPGDTSAGPALLFGTNHGFLYSISAATGKINAAFGNNGSVNLRTPEVMSTGTDKLYILPSPPVIYKNLVITGAGPGKGAEALAEASALPEIRAHGTSTPESWCGRSTRSHGREKWATTRGVATAGSSAPASTCGVT